MAFAEDLSVFFDTDGFAEVALYDGAAEVKGIHDRAYAEALGVAGTGPVFVCAAADVDAEPEGKTLAVRGVAYKVVNAHPDETGTVLTLILEMQ